MLTIDPLPAFNPLVGLLSIGALAGACVALHAAGLLGMSGWLSREAQPHARRYCADVWLLVRLSWGLIVLHLVEIAVWGVAYVWYGMLPDFSTALYFSSITYTTVGHGDVVLPPVWRNFSSAEAIVGILMTGLSTSFFFVCLSRLLPPDVAGRAEARRSRPMGGRA